VILICLLIKGMNALSEQLREQKTINREVNICGIGLHCGRPVKLVLKPAPADSGIVFKRTDLKGHPEIKAVVDNVTSTRRSTTIGHRDISIKVQTIEHLMAALRVFNIDNVMIEIDNEELPALDGSAQLYGELLKKAGVKGQKKTKRIFKIKQSIHLKEKDTYLGLFPSDVFKINYLLKYDHPIIGTEYLEYIFDKESFTKEIMPARTFGFKSEVENLKKRGLALGGSLQNAVLLDKDGVVNDLRFDDEFVRHKVLDMVGDLYLNGPIICEIIGIKTGHRNNYELNRHIQALKIKNGWGE